jgi:hypothetical protein
VAREGRDARPYYYAVRDFLRTEPAAPGQQLHMPYQLVPTAHYYHPELSTIGHDYGYNVNGIVAQLRSPSSASTMLCEQPMCDAIQQAAAETTRGQLLHPRGPTGKPLYVLHIRNAAAGE